LEGLAGMARAAGNAASIWPMLLRSSRQFARPRIQPPR
jgi:hypothetical protein